MINFYIANCNTMRWVHGGGGQLRIILLVLKRLRFRDMGNAQNDGMERQGRVGKVNWVGWVG